MITEDETQADEELEDWIHVEKAEDEARKQARENIRREAGGARVVAAENDDELDQQQRDLVPDLVVVGRAHRLRLQLSSILPRLYIRCCSSARQLPS